MRRSRVLLVLVAMVVGTLSATGPVAAGPPGMETYDMNMIECAFEAEFGFVEFHAGVELGGEDPEPHSWVDVIVFQGEEDVLFPGEPYSMSFVDGSFEAEMALFSEALGENVGTASVAGTYEQIGDLELIFEGRSKFANVVQDERLEVAPLGVAGLLEVAIEGFEPTAFDLAECEGVRELYQLWHTNPTAFVRRVSGTEMFCELEADGWFLEVFGYDVDDEGELHLTAWEPGTEPYEDMPAVFGFAEQPDLSYGALDLDVELWTPFSEDPFGIAQVEATLAQGEFFGVEVLFQNGYLKVDSYALLVEGSLTMPSGVLFDMSECGGDHFEEKVFENPNESQGKGNPPGNDAIEGSVELTNGDNVHTRMAAEGSEATCIDPDFGEIPLGKTVWYTVAGTGDPMTVDTTGSDFDTVAAVYTMEGSELVQQGCLDDNFDETGFRNVVALTFDTVADETYYVQIGGFDNQYGHLKVELR